MPTKPRRSARQPQLTLRGKDYFDERSRKPISFPSGGDEIKVKWILDDQPVWWPATVVYLETGAQSSKERRGEIFYHKLRQYSGVKTDVVFSTTTADEQFVTSVEQGSTKKVSEASSWTFADQPPRSDDDTPSSSTSADQPTSSDASLCRRDDTPEKETGRYKRRGQLKKCRRSQRHTYILGLRSRVIERRTQQTVTRKASKNNSSSRRVQPVPSQARAGSIEANTGTFVDAPPPGNDAAPESKVVSISDPDDARPEAVEVDVRLRLLERQLHDVQKINQVPMLASMNSVVVSLRWGFLKALEKPLRPVFSSDQTRQGLVQHQLSVNVHCDYSNFREIAAVLAKEHRCDSDNPNSSRVAFSPSFHTTQSGSTALTNMTIIFACLSDLTSFLRVRDDNDFESILSKEILSNTSTMLRILGVFTVSDQDVDGNTEITNPTPSVSASSEQCPTTSIFVGTAPIVYSTRSSASSCETQSEACFPSTIPSTIFQQECKHFCSTQKCFRTPWTLKQIESSHLVNCNFHLDGTASVGELKKYFTLTWRQQIAPSSTKWTKDVQDVGSNPPGVLQLNVPVISVCSSRNVTSLVSLLDNYIETFMRVRSSMHSRSSFK